MKISKNSKTNPPVDSTKDRSESITHIRAAIDALGSSAKEDIVAREAIANLSVILLDLQ